MKLIKYYIFCMLYLTLSSCKYDIYKKSNIECFNNIEKIILGAHEKLSDTLVIDFRKELKCFEWDSLVIDDFPFIENINYKDIKYKVIKDSVYGRLSLKGEVIPDEESWNYLFFYKDGKLLNDAVSFANGDLYMGDHFSLLKNRSYSHDKAVFKIIKRLDSSSCLDKKDYFKYLELNPRRPSMR